MRVVGGQIVGDRVEDEELALGPEVGRVRDAVSLRYASALRATCARVARVRLAGERVDDLADDRERRRRRERVDDRARRSGMSSMSVSEMPCQPRIEEPSKPSPSSNADSSNADNGSVMCCQRPSRSVNFRSTSFACVLPAHSIASVAAGRLPRSRDSASSPTRTCRSSFSDQQKKARDTEVPRASFPCAPLRRRAPDSTVGTKPDEDKPCAAPISSVP